MNMTAVFKSCVCQLIYCVRPHPLRVQVLHCLGDGVQHGAGLSLGEEFLFEDAVQQLAPTHQLRHQVHLLVVVVHLRQRRASIVRPAVSFGTFSA